VPRANDEVARALNELAVLTEIEEANPQAFRVRAYQNGVRAVSGLSRDVSTMSAAELQQVKGIGKAIASKIREQVDTGRMGKLEELRQKYDPGLLDLLKVPGLGAKTVQLLNDVLGIKDLDGLRSAIDEGRLRDLPGLGEKTERNLKKALERLRETSHENRMPIARALPLAEEIVATLDLLPAVQQVEYTGSLRRFRDTIGDLDVLVASDDPEPVMAAFAELGLVREVIAQGPTRASVLTWDGLQVDLRVVEPAHIGAALVYFTGSKAHNIQLRERAIKRGWTLNEYALSDAETGAVIAGATEHEVYDALDLAWVAPEMREDAGEVQAAAAGELPDLVTVEDLRGDLHDHSDWSGDGRSSLDEMVAAAAERGLSYLAITDHAENLRINGVDRAGMLRQRKELAQLQERHPDLRLLHGAELNVGRDGSLDYDEQFLLGFHWCVASVHSHFRLEPDEQTERVVAAIRHPAVNVIGHLTGRRIGKRPGIELDVEAIFDACVETGTALEINCNLDRLDAAAEVVRDGAARGVTFVVSTDAHHTQELDYHRHGVRQARRGGLDKAQIANTWDTDRFLEWAGAKRSEVRT